ncbi:hypothetical protein P9A28_gp50 [Sphingomonas phage Eidolon]|uniref:Uncharacterized protein n=1 Tax=Sphingomonas phage Eidolon TaxID=2686311 RepID=A0A6M3T819_9CAUD|nr:hypothetical protein P9A28_gp50 [Sphingomonas phage Eidolon]QJD54436.1 hypothetical protein [Sphingomonas phage Eidolon]
MDDADRKRLWADAQANVDKLNACPVRVITSL